jgi:membrane dipeptidase
MRKLMLLALIVTPAGVPGSLHAQQDAQLLERARQILQRHPVIDGHNDLPWAIRNHAAAPMDVEAYDLRTRTPGHTDLERLRSGGVGGQFWSVYVPGEVADSGYARIQLEQFDIARRIIEKYPEFEIALSAADIERSIAAGRVASLIGMEGGHAIENSLGALRAFYDLGARYMTLTHNVTLDWADAATAIPQHGGLTEFGREVVHEMNRLGMLVDLSHVSPAVMSQALDISEAPVIFSHSSVARTHRRAAQRARLDPGKAGAERRCRHDHVRAGIRERRRRGVELCAPATARGTAAPAARVRQRQRGA